MGEVAPEATHLRIDLSTMFGSLLGDDAPSLRFEIWTGPDRIVLDTRDYAAIAERNPSAYLGPFEPGVSFIDLEAVRDRPDLLAALVGQRVADPGVLADRLLDALEDLKQNGKSFLDEVREAFDEAEWTLEVLVRF